MGVMLSAILCEFLLCIPATKITAMLRRKLRFNIDEVFAWFEAVMPAVALLPFYIWYAIYKDNAYILLFTAIALMGSAFIVFLFRWLCIFIRNKGETHLQLRYAFLWTVGAIMAYFIKSKGVMYCIWTIVFLPTVIITENNNFLPTTGFIALAVFMTLVSLFCAWGYKKK